MNRDEIAAQLRDVGGRRTKALAERKRTSDELAELIPRAHAAGFRQQEIVDLTGVSRQGVRDFLKGGE
jgi:hypothetical protein